MRKVAMLLQKWFVNMNDMTFQIEMMHIKVSQSMHTSLNKYKKIPKKIH